MNFQSNFSRIKNKNIFSAVNKCFFFFSEKKMFLIDIFILSILSKDDRPLAFVETF